MRISSESKEASEEEVNFNPSSQCIRITLNRGNHLDPKRGSGKISKSTLSGDGGWLEIKKGDVKKGDVGE